MTITKEQQDWNTLKGNISNRKTVQQCVDKLRTKYDDKKLIELLESL